jgi:hypothetical protein
LKLNLFDLHKPATSATDIDDFERQKKRAKVEKILSLSHQDGMEWVILCNIDFAKDLLKKEKKKKGKSPLFPFMCTFTFIFTIILKGIVESLDMPGASSVDKEEKMMSP